MSIEYNDLQSEYNRLQKDFNRAVAEKDFKKIKTLLAKMEVIDRMQGRIYVNNMMNKPELQLTVRPVR